MDIEVRQAMLSAKYVGRYYVMPIDIMLGGIDMRSIVFKIISVHPRDVKHIELERDWSVHVTYTQATLLARPTFTYLLADFYTIPALRKFKRIAAIQGLCIMGE